ncbi:leukocyte elastase inhibitor A-like [Antennarius striatus]|uniref:leukocyte elastase inhibitor A-like n=1 Tax=Antennarius striatus TaxID=241820 RepID=UPI0035AFFD40
MDSPSPLSEANTTFALALLKKLSGDNKFGNVFFSPFSISSALAMVMLGARGNTKVQMSEVLSFADVVKPMQPCQMQTKMQTTMSQPQPEIDQDFINTSFFDLLTALSKEGVPYTLSVANRLYGEKSYEFLEKYLGDSLKFYKAELKPVDFKNGADGARIEINTWVEEKTQEKIKDLLPEGMLTQQTKLVLVNAIYFKSLWDKKFMEIDTKEAEFKVNKNNTKAVKMMAQKSSFSVSDIPEARCQVLEMPYKNEDLSMIIFLPYEIEDDTTGLERLEEMLNYERFMKWTRPNNSHRLIEVNLPRFKITEMYGLNEKLRSMEMTDAFDESRSDFSGMSSANDLVLSNVIHQCFLEVNEEGTEAAAATAAVMRVRSLRIPARFVADHPFLFFIRHTKTNSILFAGRCCSPE